MLGRMSLIPGTRVDFYGSMIWQNFDDETSEIPLWRSVHTVGRVRDYASAATGDVKRRLMTICKSRQTFCTIWRLTGRCSALHPAASALSAITLTTRGIPRDAS